jgi:hypothetical protein
MPAMGARNARLRIAWSPMLKPQAGSGTDCTTFAQLKRLREE